MVDKGSIWFLCAHQCTPLEIKGIRIGDSDLSRFLRNVTPRQIELCWEWQGCLDSEGYGAFMISRSATTGARSVVKAHRLSWILSNQENIPCGQLIRHDCDNRSCVNPHHLRPGTNSDNISDAIARGRRKYTKGEINVSQLTDVSVRSIRERYAAGGVTQKELGEEYGVSRSTICGVISGRRRALLT